MLLFGFVWFGLVDVGIVCFCVALVDLFGFDCCFVCVDGFCLIWFVGWTLILVWFWICCLRLVLIRF